MKDAAIALAEPSLDMSFIADTSTIDAKLQPRTPVDEAAELRYDIMLWYIVMNYALCYRKQNAALQSNLAKMSEKSLNDYSQNAKQRAIEEKLHKERIFEAERKKKEESNKGFFAKLFGW